MFIGNPSPIKQGLDRHATPVEGGYPGVEVHANLIAGILEQNIKHQPADVAGWELLLLAGVGLMLILLQPRLKLVVGTAVVVVLLVVVTAGNFAVFHYGNLVLPLASPVAMILILFMFNLFYGFFVEARGKRAITRLFGQYVPPQLVDEMSQDPERFSMEGDSREMTVLFTDVRGFTAISEKLEPKVLAGTLAIFFAAVNLAKWVPFAALGLIDLRNRGCFYIRSFWVVSVQKVQAGGRFVFGLFGWG